MRTGIVKKRWFSIDSTNLPPNAIIIKSLKEMKRADKERAFLLFCVKRFLCVKPHATTICNLWR
jgi:hypothetical protein